MAAADTGFHINGPAILWAGPQGNSGALEQLGISEDGVGISLSPYDDPIMTDDGGSRIPHDLQDMGSDAFIDFRLVYYDLTVLRKIRMLRDAGGIEGIQKRRGGLVFANNKGFRLAIQSETDEPWRFLFCTLRTSQRAKVGTRRTVWDMGVYAIPYFIDGNAHALRKDPSAAMPPRILYDHQVK